MVPLCRKWSPVERVLPSVRGEPRAGERGEGAGANVSVVAVPEGAITGAHYLETPHYTQITGVGDFTRMNVQEGDQVRRFPFSPTELLTTASRGGELDPHGQDGNGNPIGGLVFVRRRA